MKVGDYVTDEATGEVFRVLGSGNYTNLTYITDGDHILWAGAESLRLSTDTEILKAKLTGNL